MKKKLPFFLLLIISLIITFWLYGNVILDPNNYAFSNSGDGIKNYYTYAHHIKNNNSYFNFEGMNYPYGEHFIYTDCHPILMLTFKWLSNYFPFLKTYSIAILNELLILSVFLTFIVTYFVLLEFKIEKWIAILFCIGITLLAPQIYRMPGHFALSYSFSIPLSWLIYLRTIKKQAPPLNYILPGCINLWWLFIHAYLGIIICAFTTLLIIVTYLIEKENRTLALPYIALLCTIFIPIILFKSFVFATDTHTG